MTEQVIIPDWPAPISVKSVITTRQGGFSEAPYDSMNLALHVDDDVDKVMANRRHLADLVGVQQDKICWLTQVHGTRVVTASHLSKLTEADASDSVTPGMVCVVMTADCLPILLCNQSGTQVSVVHAGWRGLADGIVEAAIKRFNSDDQIMAYLGPAIGPDHFEVGADVYERFAERNHEMVRAFVSTGREDKYMADIYHLARIELGSLGVSDVYGGDYCTFTEAQRFYSYRRDGNNTGRMASLIWLDQ